MRDVSVLTIESIVQILLLPSCLSTQLLYPRREAGILWIHHRCRPRPQRFLISDLQSTFLSGFLSYLAGGLIW